MIKLNPNKSGMPALPKEGLVVFKTPTSRGRGGGARLFTTKTLDFESLVKVKF